MLHRFFIFTILLLLFSLVACGDGDDDNNDNDSHDDDDDDDDLTLPEGWRMELVDDNIDAGYENSIGLTSDDRVVIYYSKKDDYPGKYIPKLAQRNNNEWNIETLPYSDHLGENPLIIDGEDTIRLGVLRSGNGLLEYWSKADGEWQHQEALQQGSYFWFLEMALDSGRNPHFVFDQNHNSVFYVDWTGAGWDSNWFAYGGNSSLAIDDGDYAHLAFGVQLGNDSADENQRGKLYHAQNLSGEWEREVYDDMLTMDHIFSMAPAFLWFNSIKVAPAGNTHIGYTIQYADDYEEPDDTIFQTRYATNESSQWGTDIVCEDAQARNFTLDDQSHPHFLVYDEEKLGLVWLTREDGESSWTSTWLGLELGHTGLVIDADGYAHISYSPTYNEDKEKIHLYYLTDRPE